MFEKLPTAWLQLRYQRTRLLVALAGVVFAVLMVFMQFGLRDALFDSAVQFIEGLDGDCFLISPRTTAVIALENFSERRLYQALAFEEVEFVSPIYIGFAQWKHPLSRNYWRNIMIIGMDLRYPVAEYPGAKEHWQQLAIPDTYLFDRNSRQEFGPMVSLIENQGNVTTELSKFGNNRKINVVGLFTIGASFGADGTLLTSHVNFLRLFNRRVPHFIDMGLIKLKPGADVAAFMENLKLYLPPDVKVFSKQELIAFEQNFWDTSTAIGFIFNLGVFLGLIVGVVFIYQILYSNITEHLSEYATLKAMGYRHRYLLSMVVQQSIFIAIIGYIPGFLIATILYEISRQVTLLPVMMNVQRAILVLILTIIMSLISGFIAINKLKSADPADIF
jgi:putative ABC transport system permease protein